MIANSPTVDLILLLRPSMEDSFVIETNIKGLKSSHLFAIYDGHASHAAAHYLAKHTIEVRPEALCYCTSLLHYDFSRNS